MAGPWYLRSSDGGDGDSGLSWALAKATMAGVLAEAVAAGDIIYVDDDHQEQVATDTTYTFPGTEGNPVKVIVVETDTTTAVSNYNASNQWISGDTNNAHIIFAGEVYFWGVYIEQGDNASVKIDGKTAILENSKIKQTQTGVDYIGLSGDNSTVIYINSDIEFSNAAQSISLVGPVNFIWRGGTLGSDQDNLFILHQESPRVEVIGVDLSIMAGGTLLSIDETDERCIVCLKGLTLNATHPDLITSGISPERNSEVLMDIADNGNTVYKFRREYQYGYAQDETIKVITGKALYDGTNEFTAKMISRATPTSTFYDPWRYHLTTLRETGFAASRTYTVHIAQDHADTQPDALNDDEIWLEVVYPDDATAQYNIKSDKIATPTITPAAQTTSTETWAGLAATTRLQELSVQIDAADGKNGPVEIWVCLAKESKTVYVCPEVYVS